MSEPRGCPASPVGGTSTDLPLTVGVEILGSVPRVTTYAPTAAATSAGTTLDVHDPATDELLAMLHVADAAACAAAVGLAGAAAPGWARTSPGDRSGLLKAWARLLREHADELALLQTREGGKPLADSAGGVGAGIGAVEQYAELGPLHRGRALQGGWGSTDLMAWQPRGITVVLTPWNDPVAIVAQLLAANLAAGNPVVLKPSERTPLTGIRLVELAHAAGIPADVVQVVIGAGPTGRALVADPRVQLVCHTGSCGTGREIAVVTAQRGAKAVLELGGKDACIVDAGVDPGWAAGQVALGAFANTGQVCVSVERVYVHRAVAGAFLAALVAEAESRVPGPGTDPATTMGPLIDTRQRDVVDAHVRDAVAAGARLLTGGTVPPGPGAFYPATVLTDVPDDSDVMTVETFGPIAAVRVVDSYDEALALAADSTYGLSATVLTSDMEHAQRAWRELPVGTVKINAAFGGAPGGASHPRGGSGSGFGFGPELLDEVSAVTVVHLEPAPPAPAA